MPAIVQDYICLQLSAFSRKHNYYATSNSRTHIPHHQYRDCTSTKSLQEIFTGPSIFFNLQVNIEMRGLVFPDNFFSSFYRPKKNVRITLMLTLFYTKQEKNRANTFFSPRLKISPVILLHTQTFNYSCPFPPKPNTFLFIFCKTSTPPPPVTLRLRTAQGRG